MKFSWVISSTQRIWAKNNSQLLVRTFPVRASSKLICTAMDQGNSGENGVVEKTASQLKKEAQRLAKLEKFNKKKEKEAALAENQNQVSARTTQPSDPPQKIGLKLHFLSKEVFHFCDFQTSIGNFH